MLGKAESKSEEEQENLESRRWVEGSEVIIWSKTCC